MVRASYCRSDASINGPGFIPSHPPTQCYLEATDEVVANKVRYLKSRPEMTLKKSISLYIHSGNGAIISIVTGGFKN